MTFYEAFRLKREVEAAGGICVMASAKLPNGTVQWTAWIRRHSHSPSVAHTKLAGGREEVAKWSP